MGAYETMLGGVFISSLFVFFIWVNVFIEAWHEPSNSMAHSKLILTSVGLIINSISILMVMVCRVYALFVPYDFSMAINLCYGGMVFSDFLFLTSASIGRNSRQVKWFCVVLLAWFAFCGIVYLKGYWNA